MNFDDVFKSLIEEFVEFLNKKTDCEFRVSCSLNCSISSKFCFREVICGNFEVHEMDMHAYFRQFLDKKGIPEVYTDTFSLIENGHIKCRAGSPDISGNNKMYFFTVIKNDWAALGMSEDAPIILNIEKIMGE